MATIIKSNKVATGDFLHQTEFGLTYLEVKNYIDNQIAENSTVTQADFNALHNLHSSLRDAGVFDKVIEIMPFMGSKMQGQLTKSKFKRDEKLIGLGGLGEYEGAVDLGKGIIWEDYRLVSALALDTKLIDSDFPNGFRFSTYTNLSPATGEIHNIFGKGPSVPNSATRTFFQNGGNQLAASTGGTALSSLTETINGSCLISGHLKISSNSVIQRNGYKNGAVILNSAPSEASLNNNTTYYIGGLNPGNGEAPLYGLVGKMRFFIITDGSVNEAEFLTINNLVMQFISESAK